jgi:hypothetical protein
MNTLEEVWWQTQFLICELGVLGVFYPEQKNCEGSVESNYGFHEINRGSLPIA